jgi:hypothetical protein
MEGIVFSVNSKNPVSFNFSYTYRFLAVLAQKNRFGFYLKADRANNYLIPQKIVS